MAIQFDCPECEERIKVKDELAGRKIKCPHCTEPVRVPSEDVDEEERPARKTTTAVTEERPRKKAAASKVEDDEDRPRKKKKKKQSGNTVLIVSTAIGILILLVGGGVAVALLLPRQPAPVAKAPPPPAAPVGGPIEKKEEPKDLNKVDIGKGTRYTTSLRARAERPERMNELKQIATFYNTFRTDRGKGPQKAEEFISYIQRDSPPIKKAIEDRYYVVVSNVTQGIVAYEHDPDIAGRHGAVDGNGAVQDLTTDELVTQLKTQGSWSDDKNRPRK